MLYMEPKVSQIYGDRLVIITAAFLLQDSSKEFCVPRGTT